MTFYNIVSIFLAAKIELKPKTSTESFENVYVYYVILIVYYILSYWSSTTTLTNGTRNFERKYVGTFYFLKINESNERQNTDGKRKNEN